MPDGVLITSTTSSSSSAKSAGGTTASTTTAINPIAMSSPEKKAKNYDPFKHHSAQLQLKQMASGAFAGFITRSLTQPFDVLKIRFQLQVEPVAAPEALEPTKASTKSKYTSMRQAIRLIYREEGLRAFWKGHNSGQYMSIIFCVAQFWSYEQFYLNMEQLAFLQEHIYIRDFVSGGLAGCVGAFVSMPFDVIRTRMVAQDPGSGYKTAFRAIPVTIQTEGVRGLFRGLQATLIQVFPLIGLNFCFYNLLNDIVVDIMKRPRRKLPSYVHFSTGFLSGVLSKAILYPLDFIKKRLQVQGFEKHRQTFGQTQKVDSMIHCIRETLRIEGPLGFYKGLVPTLLKSGAQSAFYFAIYNYAKVMLEST